MATSTTHRRGRRIPGPEARPVGFARRRFVLSATQGRKDTARTPATSLYDCYYPLALGNAPDVWTVGVPSASTRQVCGTWETLGGSKKSLLDGSARLARG